MCPVTKRMKQFYDLMFHLILGAILERVENTNVFLTTKIEVIKLSLIDLNLNLLIDGEKNGGKFGGFERC